MKIYIDGCSWTEGAELDPERKEKERYSAIVADSLNAEIVNKAGGGASNYRIMRHWMKHHAREKWDLAIIQLSIPSRTEFYLPNVGYQRIQRTGKHIMSSLLPKTVEKCGERMKQYWDIHYKDIYTEKMGKDVERTAFYACKNTCIALGIPHLLLTINPDTDLPFDLNLAKMNLPLAPGFHPNKSGHRRIANKILEIL